MQSLYVCLLPENSMVYNQIVGLNFAGSNDSMEIYPAILMHILVEIWGNPYEIKNITLS